MSAHAALIRAGFPLPIQAPFFLIFDAGSMGAGYHPRVMPRPEMTYDIR